MARKKRNILLIFLYVVLVFLLIICFILVVHWPFVERDVRKITTTLSKLYTHAEVLEDHITSGIGQSGQPQVIDDGNIQLACGDDTSASAIAAVRCAVVFIKTTGLSKTPRPVDRGNISFSQAADGTNDSIGSGVIFDPKGYILTNYHVIKEAEGIEVRPFGYREKVYMARVVSTDPDNDLAILKIDDIEKFPAAVLGDSDIIEVADTVMAIGSPFGLEHTVTKGIISDDKRNIVIDGVEYKDMIQTDAAINRGNSGGPLVDINGEVIGINTAIYAPTGIFTGLGFAIPINRAKQLFAEIYK